MGCFRRTFSRPYLVPSPLVANSISKVDRNVLIAAQKSDDSIKNVRHIGNEGVACKNISFCTKAWLMYRSYRDAGGRTYDQL